MTAVGSRPKTADRRAQRSAGFVVWQLAFCGSHFRIHRSIDDPTCMQLVACREGSVSYDEQSSWRRQGLLQGRSAWSGRTLQLERQARSESLIPRGDASNRQQPYTRAAEGASPGVPEKSTNTPGSADSLLSHVEITDDFDFKDHNDGKLKHFLACEIDSRVAASICVTCTCTWICTTHAHENINICTCTHTGGRDTWSPNVTLFKPCIFRF